MMNNEIVLVEDQRKIIQKIDEDIRKIQSEIDGLRAEGTHKVILLKEHIENTKHSKFYSAEAKKKMISEAKEELAKAKEVEKQNKPKVDELIKKAKNYIKVNYDDDYSKKMVQSCKAEAAIEKENYKKTLETLKAEYNSNLSKLSDASDKKEEKSLYKNRVFEADMAYESALQKIKDKRHEVFSHKYHLIDLLTMSRFSIKEKMAQSFGNYRYKFDLSQFFYNNGLYIIILLVFIGLCILAPVKEDVHLFTVTNILNILQQATPRLFLALGVAGLILLTGTDLSVGRMVGMGMVVATIIMHNGENTGAVFGHIFDFSGIPVVGRALLALLICMVLTTFFSSVAGFFMAKFKMHPFISTMANMLIIFGLVTYATKGVSFGAIDDRITEIFTPYIGDFPTIIFWAIGAIIVVWFIWNKTTFGKNLYAVGGNPEAAAVSGISVFKVTMGAFILAGILYGIGSWLECTRMVGAGSAAYGQGWEMDAIAACVVGGVSFTGGKGKISGVVAGVLIFTALTYAFTVVGIDTNLQFIFEGVIILAAVTLDCLKYVKKK